jgi:hypothetical protein
MLKGFEQITVELNDFETQASEIVFDWFNSNPGRKGMLKNNDISALVYHQMGKSLSDARVRKIIQYLRMYRIPNIIATSNGYICSEDIKDIENWIISLRQREASIRTIREKAEKHLEIARFRKYAANQMEIF